jgi:hypothetical protein
LTSEVDAKVAAHPCERIAAASWPAKPVSEVVVVLGGGAEELHPAKRSELRTMALMAVARKRGGALDV